MTRLPGWLSLCMAFVEGVDLFERKRAAVRVRADGSSSDRAGKFPSITRVLLGMF